MRPTRVLLDALAPLRCLACGRAGRAPWCIGCQSGAPLARVGCRRCADPWPSHDCPFEDSAILASMAVWAHGGALRDVIVGAKARGAWAGWETLGGPLAQAVRGIGWPVDAVVGVPTPAPVVRRRGIDHGARLASAAARILDRPSCVALLADPRRRDVVTQARDPRRAAHDGYAVGRPVEGQVLLVDDVMTTGTTALQAATALAHAGAAGVRVAVLARAGQGQRPSSAAP